MFTQSLFQGLRHLGRPGFTFTFILFHFGVEGGDFSVELAPGGGGWDGAAKGCLEVPHPPPKVSHGPGSVEVQATFAEKLVSHREGPTAPVVCWVN